MAKLRLTERLRAVYGGAEYRASDNPEDVLRSVRDHILLLAECRQGGTLLDPDFGLPDFSKIRASFSEDDIPFLVQTLTGFISAYEQRVENIRIEFHQALDVEMTLAFTLNANLRDNPERIFSMRLLL